MRPDDPLPVRVAVIAPFDPGEAPGPLHDGEFHRRVGRFPLPESLPSGFAPQPLRLHKTHGLLAVVTGGGRHPDYREEDGARVMKQSEITIRVHLHRGEAVETVWTCDFSHDYVTINADYRS